MITRVVAAAVTTIVALSTAFAASAAADSMTQSVSPTTVSTGTTVLSTQFLDGSGVSNPTYTNTVSLRGDHTLDPSSVQAPNGTKVDYSVDGASYGLVPSSASRYVRFRGALASGAGAASQVGAPSNDFQAGAPGADGYAPILTANRVFNVNHHADLRIECRELDTGATCAGYPFSFPSQPVTGWAPHGVIDTQTGRLWVPAVKPDAPHESGFACIQVGQDSTTPPSDCGWVKTGTGSIIQIYSTWGGSVTSGNSFGRKIYAIDINAKVHCVDMATAVACAGQPYDVGLPVTDGVGTQLTRIGDTSKFIARSNPPAPNLNLGITPGPSKVMCFDAATDAACAGWSGPKMMGTSDLVAGKTVNGSVISAQIGSGWDAFCGILAQNYPGSNTGSSSLDVSCLKLSDGTSAPVPAGLAGTSLTSGQTGWQFGLGGVGEATTSGTRVYFTNSRFSGPVAIEKNDRLICYDYEKDAVCAGYPSEFYGGRAGNEFSKTYATAVDATGTCVWTLGDPGQLVQHNATEPNKPCATAAVSVNAKRANSYCGTTPGNVATAPWDKVRIRNATPGSEYQFALVTIQDKTGATLPGFDHLKTTATTIDISGIPATGNTSQLQVSVEFSGAQSAKFTSGAVVVEATWASEELSRTCVGSRVEALSCTSVTTPLAFDAAATFAPGGGSPGPVRTASNTLTRSQAEVDGAKAALAAACQTSLPPVTPPLGGQGALPTRTTPKATGNGSKKACSAVTAKGYRVRANQRNTITVRVKTSSKSRPRVRLSGAGIRASKLVSKTGVATFKVKPKKAGRIRVTASGCVKVASVKVGKAKRAQRRGVAPTFTG